MSGHLKYVPYAARQRYAQQRAPRMANPAPPTTQQIVTALLDRAKLLHAPTWQDYETFKQELVAVKLTPEIYEWACQQLAKAMRL